MKLATVHSSGLSSYRGGSFLRCFRLRFVFAYTDVEGMP